MEDNKQQQGGNSSKVLQKFHSSLKKVEALMGDPTWYKDAKKVNKDEIPNILVRLTEGKKQELVAKLETALINLIEDKQKYDKILKEKEGAFMKAVVEEMQKFQQRMDSVFSMVDQLEDIEKSYYATLGGIATLDVKSPLAGLQEKISEGSTEGDTTEVSES